MHVLLTGATGLVGQGVLHECLQAGDVTRVTALLRRSTGRSDPRLHELLLPDFAEAARVQDRLAGIDACLYCAGAPPIGTATDDYRHVTLDLTLAVARAYAAGNPRGRFLYISGAHSDPGSRIMPLRVKGETEDALRQLPIITVMLRPGAIQPVHGERTSHALLKPVYALGGPLMGLAVKWLPGTMTTTAAVGRALLALARMPDPPRIVENAEINRIAAGG
jgi:uncharacterized protein YbjT (DUF2867 family)